MNNNSNNNINSNNTNSNLPPQDLLSVFNDNNSNKSNNINNQIDNQENFNNYSDKKNISELIEISEEDSINLNKNNTGDNIDLSDYVSNSGVVELDDVTVRANRWYVALTVVICVCFAIILVNVFKYFGFEIYVPVKKVKTTQGNVSTEYVTKINSDILYEDATVNSLDDARSLIKLDSEKQKYKCGNSKVKKVEQRIEDNYGILAVNFCEMDYEFALELEKVLDDVYKEFPDIKGYLTNLTLTNTEDGYIAAFNCAKLFASSSTVTKYPKIYKITISLNADYYLSPLFQEIVLDKAYENYFPRNATRSSILAHEMGHYLSYIALLRNSKKLDSTLLVTVDNSSLYKSIVDNSNDCVFSEKIVTEAYENYKNKYSYSGSISDFIYSISTYAIENYDETIAESFHDCYLNGENASGASKEVLNVLKKYLNNK